MDEGLQVKFWGTRGSCPAPFLDRMVYGGNTSCVSVQWDRGIAVFDGGTGIGAFGRSLGDTVKSKELSISIFVSHVHLDHIMGIPLFPMLFWKEAVIHFYGPKGEGISFRERLSKVLGPPYWPVAVDQVPARVVWHDVGEETQWELPGKAQVRAMRANHPNGSFMYRLDHGGESVVYGLDCELGEEGLSPGQEPGFENQYRDFARNCSLLIFDAPYTRENYPCYRGFGHSFWEMGIKTAESCNAGRLCICHHDWDKRDEQLEEREKELKRLAKTWGRPAEFAREGASICLKSRKENEL